MALLSFSEGQLSVESVAFFSPLISPRVNRVSLVRATFCDLQLTAAGFIRKITEVIIPYT